MDFRLSDADTVNITESIPILNLPISIRLQVEDDAAPEQVEKFVLEVTSTELDELSTKKPLEVFVANSVTVTIHDNDGREICSLVLFKLTYFSFQY